MIIIGKALKDCKHCMHSSVCLVKRELDKVPSIVWKFVDINENGCRSYRPTTDLAYDDSMDNINMDSITIVNDLADGSTLRRTFISDNEEQVEDNPISDIAQAIFDLLEEYPDAVPECVRLSSETEKYIMEQYNKANIYAVADHLIHFEVSGFKVPVQIDNSIEYGSFEIEY